MKNIEIALPREMETSTLVQIVDGAITAAGLTTSMRNTLRKYPGCIHWQLNNGNRAGSLELTFWPKEGRAWFTLPEGRRADWIDGKIEEIRKALLQRFQGRGR